MEFLSCKDIEKKFGDFLLSVSFETEEGSFTSIVGPSGSGKSTILRIIAGLLKSDGKDTKIMLGGRDITSLAPQKRECGMVFQSPSLFKHMNVEDNVCYGLKCRGTKKSEAKKIAQELLALVHLENFAKRPVESLSGGEAQRVSLARTLAVRPKLLLLDEPLSALDAPLRKSLAAEICHLQKEMGFTALMVTHDLEEAKAMGSKIILLKKGKITWQGQAQNFSESMFEEEK